MANIFWILATPDDTVPPKLKEFIAKYNTDPIHIVVSAAYDPETMGATDVDVGKLPTNLRAHNSKSRVIIFNQQILNTPEAVARAQTQVTDTWLEIFSIAQEHALSVYFASVKRQLRKDHLFLAEYNEQNKTVQFKNKNVAMTSEDEFLKKYLKSNYISKYQATYLADVVTVVSAAFLDTASMWQECTVDCAKRTGCTFNAKPDDDKYKLTNLDCLYMTEPHATEAPAAIGVKRTRITVKTLKEHDFVRNFEEAYVNMQLKLITFGNQFIIADDFLNDVDDDVAVRLLINAASEETTVTKHITFKDVSAAFGIYDTFNSETSTLGLSLRNEFGPQFKIGIDKLNHSVAFSDALQRVDNGGQMLAETDVLMFGQHLQFIATSMPSRNKLLFLLGNNDYESLEHFMTPKQVSVSSTTMVHEAVQPPGIAQELSDAEAAPGIDAGVEKDKVVLLCSGKRKMFSIAEIQRYNFLAAIQDPRHGQHQVIEQYLQYLQLHNTKLIYKDINPVVGVDVEQDVSAESLYDRDAAAILYLNCPMDKGNPNFVDRMSNLLDLLKEKKKQKKLRPEDLKASNAIIASSNVLSYSFSTGTEVNQNRLKKNIVPHMQGMAQFDVYGRTYTSSIVFSTYLPVTRTVLGMIFTGNANMEIRILANFLLDVCVTYIPEQIYKIPDRMSYVSPEKYGIIVRSKDAL